MKIRFLTILVVSLFVTGVQAQIDRSKMPEPGEAPEIDLGSPETFQLQNGLTVMVVENHKLPRVSTRLRLDNKPYAHGDKVGVTALYSAMMGNGTDDMDKDEFNKRVDKYGANVNYGSQSASASSLSKFFPEIFELMADGLLHPRFTDQSFGREKKKLIEGIKSKENDTKAIARDLQSALPFGKDHPYGEFETVASVEGLDKNDVESYYKNFISPKNAYLVVVGDVKAKKIKKMAKKKFKHWNNAQPPSQDLPDINDAEETQINFVDVPSADQSQEAFINLVDLKMADDDYVPALITNQILGGGADARLFNNLREDKGYTYGAYSRLGNDKYGAARFMAAAGVRNGVTDSAVVAFLDEIKGIREEKVDSAELALAKAKYTGNFVRSLEDPSAVAKHAVTIETENLPDDFYENYLKRIDETTAEDVQRAAQNYIKPDHLRIVIAGKGSDVIDGLETIEYNGDPLPVKYFDKEGNPVDKPEYNQEVPEDVTVKSIYDDYIEAIGGKEAVEGINTLYSKYKGSVGGQELEMTKKETKKGKSLIEVASGGMTVQKTVFDGENGYTEVQGQKKEFGDDEIEEAKAQSGLFPELQVPEDAEVTGIEQIGDEKAYAVEISEAETVYYSVDSGLKLQSKTQAEQGASTAKFMDYQTVDSVKFPHTIEQSMGPQTIELEADKITPNQKMKKDTFQWSTRKFSKIIIMVCRYEWRVLKTESVWYYR